MRHTNRCGSLFEEARNFDGDVHKRHPTRVDERSLIRAHVKDFSETVQVLYVLTWIELTVLQGNSDTNIYEAARRLLETPCDNIRYPNTKPGVNETYLYRDLDVDGRAGDDILIHEWGDDLEALRERSCSKSQYYENGFHSGLQKDTQRNRSRWISRLHIGSPLYASRHFKSTGAIIAQYFK